MISLSREVSKNILNPPMKEVVPTDIKFLISK